MGRILFSKNSFCSGAMAGVAAAYPSVPVAKKARGTALNERRVRFERFMVRKTKEDDWADGVLVLKQAGPDACGTTVQRRTDDLGDNFLHYITEVVGKTEGTAVVVVD